MKNFTQVNRALAAEKNFNLIEMLRGCSKRSGTTFRQSNPDGQPTVNRQSRLMSHQGYLRNLAMIFAVLVMSIGNVWGAISEQNVPSSTFTCGTTSGYATYFYTFSSDAANSDTIVFSAYDSYDSSITWASYTGGHKGSSASWKDKIYAAASGTSEVDRNATPTGLAHKVYNSGNYYYVRSTRTLRYLVTNCTGAMISGYVNSGYTLNLKAYLVTKGTPAASAAQTASITATSQTTTSISGLTASNTYLIEISGSADDNKHMLCEVAFIYPHASSCSDDTGLAYGTGTVDKTYGDASFTNTLTNSNSLSVTYSSSNTDVATVNSSTGAVTIKAAGATTITANWEGNATYCADAVSYTLNVKPNAVVDATNANGWRYSIGETIDLTCTAEGGTGTKTYQWQKYIGSTSTWTDINTTTNASAGTAHLQIANCTSSNGGSYRCLVTANGQTKESNAYVVYIFTLNGNYDDDSWTENAIEWTGANTGRARINLAAGRTYKFKVTNNDGKWFGCNTGVTIDMSDWKFRTNEGHCVLTTGGYGGGAYTFDIDISYAGDNNISVSVTYPKKTTYMQLCSDWKADDAKYAIYYWKSSYNGWTDFMTAFACDGDVLSADVPVWATDAFFVRFDPAKESTGDFGDEWNRSGDNVTTLPTDGKDYYQSLSKGGNGQYYGSWTTFSPTTYTISFAGNGNTDGSMSSISSIACDADQQITANAFEKTGYTFANWTANVDVKVGGATVSAGSAIANSATIQNVSSDIALTAQWTAKQCTVTFDKESGSGGSNNATATYDAAMPDITPPTRAGYDFAGYWDGDNGTGTQYYKATGKSERNWDKNTTSNTTLYAKWTAHVYTVTLNADGGSVSPASLSATYNSTLGTDAVVSSITLSNYTYAGFYTEVAGGGTNLINTSKKWIKNKSGYTSNNDNPKWVATSDVTLYAKWTRTVIIDDNGGSADGSVDVVYKGTASTPSVPTYAGHTVDLGYYAESGCSTKVMNLNGTLVSGVSGWTNASSKWIQTGSNKLYAHWKCNTPTITDNGDNTVTITVPSGTTVRYTTDGTTPTSSTGTVYSSAIDIAANVTVQAIAYQSGCTDSEVASQACTYHAPASLTAISAGVVYDADEMIPYGQTVTNEDIIFNDESYSTGNLFYTKAGAEGPKANTKDKPGVTIGEGEDYEASFNTNMMYIKGTATLSGTPKTPSAPSIKFKIPAGGGTLYLYGPSNTTAKFIKEGDTDGTAIANSNKYISVSVSGGDICYIYGSSTSTSGFYGLKLVATVPCTAAPTVTAGSNSSVTSTTATVSCTGGITSLGTGGCSLTSYGFVVGTSTNPEIDGEGVTRHQVGTSIAASTSFSKDLTGLTASTTYYVRPYATNGFGTAYGTETSFTTTAAPTLYTVTFDSNGGSTTPDAIEQASEGASITMPAAPTYAGHTFQGWVIGGTTYAAGASYTPTANITAYASWKETCAGGGSSGATLFSQNFNSATAVAYAAATARTYTTSSTLEGLVGSGANLFTSMTMIQKNDCGIGTNSTTGGNSRNYTGKFGAYCNNTQSGGLWSICRTSDFAVSAPTAIKVEFKLLVNYLAGGTPIEIAIGNGFSDGISAPAYNKIYTGFGINAGSSSAIKACKFGGTTALTNNTITNNTELQYTWIINATGSDLEYDDPAGGKQTLSTGTFDLWIGTTLYLDGQSRTAAGNTAFSGTTMQEIYIGDPQGKKCDITLDDFVVTDLTPAGGGCYYVTYDGNGADGGSVTDAVAHASGSNVTVLGNTDHPAAFTKTGYRFDGWNTSATGNGTAYAAGATISSISADVTLYAQWVADACSAPSAPTISGTSVRTVGQTITLNAACATGADASTTYTWYKGGTWETKSQVQAALTAGEGGRIFNKASCVTGDAGTYWCEASNGDDCEAHNATGFTVTVNDAAGDEHIYFYKDDNHYSDGVYSDPEGNTASNGDNKALSSPWTICNACMTGVDSVVAHNATYDGKGNHMNAYIKLPTGGNATTNNVKFALSAGYTGTLTVKIGGYNSNPTVSLYKLTSVNGAIDGNAITPTSGEVGGVATTEDDFNDIEWSLSTAGGTYVLTVTSKTGYISQIDMTTETSARFNVTYNGNDNTGGSVPTDDTDYASGATVTVAANSGSLVKTNYTGAGWNTANNGTGTNYVPGSGQFKITANTTLYAHWTQLITLAPGAQGTGTNNAAVSWNGSVLRGFAAHTASGYALQGYYTEPSGGTKVLNADGSFAATNIDGFVTSGKWSNTGAAPTLYAQWEASNLLKWNLKVNVEETSITTLSKESAVPTVIAVANMVNLTNNGSLTITGSAKSGLTSKIATTASATGGDAGKYMSVQFIVAAGYQLVPSDIKVKVQPISHSQTTKLILEDSNSHSISYTSGSLSKGSTQTVTMTNSEEVAFTGTVTLKIYVYGTEENDGYRLGTPIEINGSVEATCATPPTFDGLSYDATEYTVGASASAISVTGAENVDTYLWKQNDVNDRSGGTAASGTNNAPSYTPPTSAADTMYYWCEMTNVACCITIKTAAVGIMVRNATTDPTVTWSDVKLNDATATPNYGGGNYVLRATVNETSWPGTLAASMITAPAGIRIHHVTTGTDASKEYIEFQFDVTTAFDRASNATIDFNLALPEAGSYSALNSVKSVTYNDCSGGAAGQVAIKMGATASTSKSNPQNYWETAGAGRLMYNYGSSMGSTNNSSGYMTADSTFYYYAASTGQKWMFQTYIAGVNKVRVVFRAAGTIKSSKATITDFYYNTEYFASPGSNAVSFGEVNANKAGYSSGEDGYIEFTVPEMAANSYGAFVTGDGNMKVYGVVLYSENAGDGGSVATNPAWSDSKADEFTVNKTQSDANFTYTISTTTNTLGAISYSSSNPSVAAVDPVTGEVTITATGASAQNAKITATLARSGCYQGATRTYTINVAGYSCSEPSGSVELTSGSATKCAGESVTLTMTGFTEGADIQWYNGDSPISTGDDYEIETTATRSTLTTAAAGSYSAIATVDGGCASGAKRTNTVTIANLDMSKQKTIRKVSQWYVKNGRPTPDIALWQLGEGETFKSVAWSSSNGTGLDFRTDTETGIVYLEGKEPSTNETGNDIEYTLTLTVTDACGTDHALSGQTIKLTHQKNTDKHVLAFVVNGTAKGGFTEGITAAQTTNVDLYNAIAAQFDVQATNIYSTDDEQKLREYYSQYDILCITDYPNTQTKGVNSKSYVDAIGALIDIRPILTMEAYVSSLSNWKLKGVSGNPKSPTTRQYTMDLQCKDHEIFHGVTTTKIGEGDEAMYRVTVVDKSQEEYKTLDANYGDGEHKANEGYQYGKKPALQGFTYTEEMSDNDMLPLGLIDDGAGNKLQVGIERQKEMSARMMVLGINSYAMERLDGDGETIVINALKYLMKKNAEDISDCSVYFDGSDETDPTNWDNELNWGPSYASLPLPHQEVRILKECVVKDGVVARASGIKIIPRGRINHDTDEASGSLTIEPGGALIVDGEVRAATAPNYFNAYPTTPSNLVLQSNSSAQAALILDNSEGETQATVEMWNPSYWVMEGGKKKKYWSYVAVPIQEADIPNFFWYGFTYLYDETSGWIKKGDGTSLYPFQGIGASLQDGHMETFYGPLATTESQDITLTYTEGKGQGMNLIGNSWTAPIQIANFEEDDFGDAAAEVWVFNTGNKNDGTPGSGSSSTAGQWNTIPINAPSLPGYEGLKVIPAMQAFEVNTESETTLHLDYDRLVRAGRENLNEPMRAPRRSAAKQIEATMRVRVSGESTHTDVYLLKDARFSDGFDNGWDGHYLSGDDRSAKLYAISVEEGKLAFLAQPEIEGTQLGFAPSKHGNEYTFSFSYDGDEEYYLNDIKLKTSTLISEDATYSFTYGDGDTNRFYISRTPIDAPQTPTGVDNTGNGEVKARKFIYRDKMYIMINGRVYSADGALVK